MPAAREPLMSVVSDSTVSQRSAASAAAVDSGPHSSAGHAPASPTGRPKSAQQGTLRQQFAYCLHRNFMTTLHGDSLDDDMPNTPRSGKKGTRYRGVTKHKRTQRFEAHIWEAKKQIYLGGFDSEVLAAKSHDIMALRCKGSSTDLLNFPMAHYAQLAPMIDRLSREDVVTALRNYSKAQSCKKAGINTTFKGGVHKVVSPRSPSKHASQSPFKLAIHTGHTQADEATSDCTSGKEVHISLASAGRSAGEQADRLPGAGEGRVPLRHSPRTPQPRHQHTFRGGASFSPVATSLAPARAGASRTLRAPPAPPCAPAPAATMPRLLSGLSSTSGLASYEKSNPQACQVIADAIAMLAASEPPSPEAGRPTSWGGAAFSPFGSAHSGRGTVYAGHAVSLQQEASGLDDFDLDGVLCMLASEEPSLTFSASEESRLYEWTPVDSAHSGMEHTLNGTVLFRNPAQREEHHQAAQELTQETSYISCATQCSALLPPFLPTPFDLLPDPHDFPGGATAQGGPFGMFL